MSKAFTSEENEDEGVDQIPSLPPGVRNYMTRRGAEKWRETLERLQAEWKSLSSDLEEKARGVALDRQLRFYLSRLETLEVVDPLGQPNDQVLFGASVRLSDEKGSLETWRIVGVDEMDLDQGWISWRSPLASALLQKRVGDLVSFMGRRLKVLSISYHE